jgi:hypothetical protein
MGFTKTNPRAAGTESLTHLLPAGELVHRRRLLPARSAEWPLWVGLLVLLVGLILPNSIGVGRATLWKLRSY